MTSHPQPAAGEEFFHRLAQKAKNLAENGRIYFIVVEGVRARASDTGGSPAAARKAPSSSSVADIPVRNAQGREKYVHTYFRSALGEK